MGYIPIKGITISSYPYKEKDRVIIIFSDKLGKIKAIIRSVRSLNSKRSGLSDEFLYEKILIYQKRNRFTITDVSLIDAFVEARAKIENYKVLLYIKELIILLTPYEQPDNKIFSLILNTLSTLESTDNPDTLLISFILYLLKYVGYPVKLPETSANIYYFFPELGGFNNIKGITVSKEVANEIVLLSQTPVKNTISIHDAKTILKLLNDFIAYHADSKHFEKFLETIEKLINI